MRELHALAILLNTKEEAEPSIRQRAGSAIESPRRQTDGPKIDWKSKTHVTHIKYSNIVARCMHVYIRCNKRRSKRARTRTIDHLA